MPLFSKADRSGWSASLERARTAMLRQSEKQYAGIAESFKND
jgi:hypothetical protein